MCREELSLQMYSLVWFGKRTLICSRNAIWESVQHCWCLNLSNPSSFIDLSRYVLKSILMTTSYAHSDVPFPKVSTLDKRRSDFVFTELQNLSSSNLLANQWSMVCFHKRTRGVTERAKKLLKNTSWQKITLIVLEKKNMIWTCLSLGPEVGMF